MLQVLARGKGGQLTVCYGHVRNLSILRRQLTVPPWKNGAACYDPPPVPQPTEGLCPSCNRFRCYPVRPITKCMPCRSSCRGRLCSPCLLLVVLSSRIRVKF